MKKMFTILVAGSALVATPTLACEFTGSNSLPVATSLNDASATSVAVGYLAQAMANLPKVQDALGKIGCSQQQFFDRAVALNGGDPKKLLQRSADFKYPSLLPPEPVQTASAPPAQAAPAVQPAPAPQTEVPASVEVSAPPAAPAAAAPAPQPVRTEVDLTEVYASIDANRQKLEEIEKKPVSELTTDEKQLLAELPALKGRLAAVEKLLSDGLPEEGVVQVAALTKEQRAALASLDTTSSYIESKLGRGWLDGMTVGNTIGFFLLLILGFVIRRKLVRRIGLKANAEDLDAIQDEVEALKSRMTANEEKIESVGQQSGAVDIRFGDGQREQLDILLEGETLLVDISVDDGSKFKIRFKRVENGLFVADEPKTKFRNHDPKVAIANPYKFVCRNYGKGEFAGFMLSVAAAA